MKLTLSQIAQAIGVGCDSTRLISTLLTDSRSLCEPDGALFFALKTSVNDGHRYIADLYRKGVRAFVVSSIPEIMAGVGDVDFLVVDDPLAALQKLAATVRGSVSIPVVGITGSRGKTVVKELLYAALLKAGRHVVRSPRSWNSQIGVPLSIWELTADADFAIFEAGIDRSGQMQALEAMIRPTVGVLTAITDEHAAGFASKEEKTA